MKKSFLVILSTAIMLCCFIQCKKNVPLNIVLYTQPLKTIQHYIQGRWRFIYGKGGISSNTMIYCDKCFTEFTSANRVLVTNGDGTFLADTTIQWIRDIGSYTYGDSTYLMKFYDKHGYPNVYVIDRIYYDTLIYHDHSADPVFYHYVK
jgi:hypothetical protein